MINRYSSRRKKLDEAFLNKKLKGALAYDRIAGYFSSSIFEVAGEAIEQMKGSVRLICNSEMEIDDVKTASAAINSMRREWCNAKPEEIYANAPKRLKKLYDLIKSGKLNIKVIPNDVFGLIHGKAGVITLNDGKKTAFMGSVNETYSGWKLNYEMLWEDDSQEAIDWVQEEFDYFWNSPYAVPLSDFIIEDIKRISERKVIYSVDEWKEKPEAASTVIEAPVYRREFGLWEHQKFFVNLAFNDHKKPYGARYILADMVGLGKTVQLALSAQLMALYGDKPVLIIAPKTLLWQWQDEINSLLDMPSAVWTGREWVDENGVRYPSSGDAGIKKCPRRVGIISQGLITAGSESIQHLLSLEYECVIVDEAHRARRKKYIPGKEDAKPDPNNLMKFLLQISNKTKSMLLATATPVQLYPIEAWDLLNILSQANDSVLGSSLSMWRKHPGRAIDLIMEREVLDRFNPEVIDWIRNPFPPAHEGEMTFGRIRTQLDMAEDQFVIKPEAINRLSGPDQRRIRRIIDDNFMTEHNPFIRHIVRRTRDFLENTINPETGETYLKAVKVKLMGEKDDEAIVLPPYLQEAYRYAEEFSKLLQKRVKGGGFLKTLLLKRVGSTMIAGRNTAEKMLNNWGSITSEDDFENEDCLEETSTQSEIKNITEEERECLIRFIETLDANKEKDPKYQLLLKLLIEDNWIERGCIIFSQFFDSAYWVAENLSKDLPKEKIGIYAGGDKSGLIIDGIFEKRTKEEIKQMVKKHELKVLIGTDAASEGLNLQTLGTLINLDLPWNPTRLEQRKGRIQRIGQVHDEVYIYNMRYKGSVEDKVHSILSERLGNIHELFGQIPDILEDVWVKVAVNEVEEARKKIDEIPKQHPFELRYHVHVGKVDWESCEKVLDSKEKRKYLMTGWNTRV
ncbi:phospholipase D-like domain-containing anti-phage protein [Clostridium thermopalmarium]|uniref:RNA polymerase-associated protein RapA n=1 Tax=Clostridium thermopalmarium DSM 5974 TaxID=1121340 RepID=A0A2T0AMN3_9CLOT|nr:phospholipase D-like domain-containing anti-phage protein [Clostridium thermopalmarium]PRR70129.1 RNA polymerase-associated protein RapA [Clostridium thermopalmarium DSM 5974]PVZ23144.1 SNF2 domain-containing protein [Clostridium thermopalmarium DSM 5974]